VDDVPNQKRKLTRKKKLLPARVPTPLEAIVGHVVNHFSNLFSTSHFLQNDDLIEEFVRNLIFFIPSITCSQCCIPMKKSTKHCLQ
jgi:hypothetical protein